MLDRMFPKIRAVILKIPKGKVATYGQVATAAGFPGAARQVVWALRSARGLPWHRVLGAGGKICLPGEPGFEQKMRLSNEGVTFRGERVRMDLHQHEFRKKAAARAKRNVKKL
jgi:methylated-DNA-protein-cysteine methyltransferase-like protein